jgi:hypothetical protein
LDKLLEKLGPKIQYIRIEGGAAPGVLGASPSKQEEPAMTQSPPAPTPPKPAPNKWALNEPPPAPPLALKAVQNAVDIKPEFRERYLRERQLHAPHLYIWDDSLWIDLA